MMFAVECEVYDADLPSECSREPFRETHSARLQSSTDQARYLGDRVLPMRTNPSPRSQEATTRVRFEHSLHYDSVTCDEQRFVSDADGKLLPTFLMSHFVPN